MRFVKVWHKLAFLVCCAIGSLAILAYITLARDWQHIRQEKSRLAALQLITQLRQLFENVESHRTASLATLAGDPDMRPLLLVSQEKVTDSLQALQDWENQFGLALGSYDAWHAVQDRWEDLQGVHLFRTIGQSEALHGQVLGDIRSLIARIAEGAELAEAVPDLLLGEIDVISQSRARAMVLAARKEPDAEDSIRLRAHLLQLGASRDRVDRDLRSAMDQNGAMGEACDDLRVENAVGTQVYADFIERTLLQSTKASVAPSVVFLAARRSVDTAYRLWDVNTSVSVAQAEQKMLRAQRHFDYLALWLGAAGLLMVSVSFLIAYGTTRQVRAINQSLEQVAQGDFSEQTRIYTRDELGRTAVLLNGLVAEMATLSQAQQDRDQLEAAVAKLLDEVHGAAKGDLTREAEVTPGLTGSIADAFNFMVRHLRQMISRVQNASDRVSLSAGQIQTMTEHLSEWSGTQAGRIQEITESVHSMANSIRQVSDNSGRLSDVAQQARANAVRGTKSVQRTGQMLVHVRDHLGSARKCIRRLTENSRDAVEVGQLLDDLAEWTSILALNASLHATAADGMGQRFTMIGETAERLALRSTDAARKLSRLIANQSDTSQAMDALENASRQVMDASLVANHAAQAIMEIEAVFHRLTELVTRIAGEAAKQAHGSGLVSTTMREIADVTRKTANGTKQTVVSVTALSRLAEELRNSASSFRLPEAGDHDMLASAPDIHHPDPLQATTANNNDWHEAGVGR